MDNSFLPDSQAVPMKVATAVELEVVGHRLGLVGSALIAIVVYTEDERLVASLALRHWRLAAQGLSVWCSWMKMGSE